MFYSSLFTLLILLPTFTVGFIVHISGERWKNETFDNPHGSISCSCDGKREERALPEHSLDQIFEHLQNEEFCNGSYAVEVCGMLKTCHNCTAESIECSAPPNRDEKYNCYTRRLEMRERYFIKKYKSKADMIRLLNSFPLQGLQKMKAKEIFKNYSLGVIKGKEKESYKEQSVNE